MRKKIDVLSLTYEEVPTLPFPERPYAVLTWMPESKRIHDLLPLAVWQERKVEGPYGMK